MRVAFLFDKEAEFPPSVDNMKAYYMSKELERRKVGVIWAQQTASIEYRKNNGIIFYSIGKSRIRLLGTVLDGIRVSLFVIRNRIDVVYLDEWLYFRHSPLRRLVVGVLARISGIRFIVDKRDPYVDFEIARGSLAMGTIRHASLLLLDRLLTTLANLVILPSSAYARQSIAAGVPPAKIFGTFRGIDTARFTPEVDAEAERKKFGLDGRIVIGWFGMMHRHLLIREVIIPMIKSTERSNPGVFFLIGGKGPFARDFEDLRRDDPSLPFEYLGLVPYDRLPEYLASCDLLLCPVSNDYNFSRLSSWLKIPEALSVGRPVVATRTEIADADFKTLKGVVWTGPTSDEFIRGVEWACENLGIIKASAMEQSQSMGEFSLKATLPRIVDRVVQEAS
jgi:glycosyltransferase involved in cell wall biosynthesis